MYNLYDDLVLSTLLHLKRIQWAGIIVRMDDRHIPNNIMGEWSGGRRPVKKPRGRHEDAVRRDTVDFLQIQNWKTSARDKDSCRQKSGSPHPENRLKHQQWIFAVHSR